MIQGIYSQVMPSLAIHTTTNPQVTKCSSTRNIRNRKRRIITSSSSSERLGRPGKIVRSQRHSQHSQHTHSHVLNLTSLVWRTSIALTFIIGVSSAFVVTPPQATLPKISSSSSSTSTPSSPLSSPLIDEKANVLKSFLSFDHPIRSVSSSSSSGKIITKQSRYGGRTTSNVFPPIIVNSPTMQRNGYNYHTTSMTNPSKRNVLGFDLKMVSPSIEESQMENSSNSSRNTRGGNSRNSSDSNHKSKTNKDTTCPSSNNNLPKNKNECHSSKQPRQSQDYRGTIGIDTLNHRNASPIKKQIVSNLLQSRNYKRGAIGAAAAATTTSSGSRLPHQHRRNMNPFHFDQTVDSSSTESSSSSPSSTSIIDWDENIDRKNVSRSTYSSSTTTRKAGGDKGDSNHGGSNVPMWFPYIPTRQQIETLKIVELKDACSERGLFKVSSSGY